MLSRLLITGVKSAPRSAPRFFASLRHAPRHDIIIGGAAAKATVLSVLENNDRRPTDLTIIGSKSWISRIHESWYDRPWGQNSSYLPGPIRKIFDRLFPNYPENEKMKFGQIQATLAALEESLRAHEPRGLRRIEMEIQRLAQEQDRLTAHFVDDNTTPLTLTTGSHFHVFNTAVIPRSPANLDALNFGEAYTTPRGESREPLFVIGAGLSLEWACRDFPDRPIIHIMPPGDRMREDLHGSLHASIGLSNTTIEDLPDGSILITAKNMKDGEWVQFRTERTNIYSAMGFQLNRSLVNEVDERNVTQVNTASQPTDIRTVTALSSGDSSRRAVGLRTTVTPPGSLLANYLQIHQSITGSPPPEPNAVLLMTAWKAAVSKKLAAENISIHPDFFRSVEDRVLHACAQQVPHESQLMTLIENAYKKGIYDDHSEKWTNLLHNPDGTPTSWEQFKTIINLPSTDKLEPERDSPPSSLRT